VHHTWHYDGKAHYSVDPEHDYWRRVELLPDGGMLVVFDPYGVIKIDRDSNLVWATGEEVLAHHDLYVTGEGLIYALGKKLVARPEGRKPIFEDQIVILDANGKTLDRFSIRQAFEGTPAWPKLKAEIPGFQRRFGEDFHVNTIQVLDGSLANQPPLLKKGNIVSCSPMHRNYWIIDGDTRRVVWHRGGPWRSVARWHPRGHDPRHGQPAPLRQRRMDRSDLPDGAFGCG
jgi:hypothetical protein